MCKVHIRDVFKLIHIKEMCGHFMACNGMVTIMSIQRRYSGVVLAQSTLTSYLKHYAGF